LIVRIHHAEESKEDLVLFPGRSGISEGRLGSDRFETALADLALWHGQNDRGIKPASVDLRRGRRLQSMNPTGEWSEAAYLNGREAILDIPSASAAVVFLND